MSYVASGAVSIVGSTNWSLPNADWSFVTMVKVDNNEGTGWNTFVSAGTDIGTGELTGGLLENGRTGGGNVAFRVGDGTNLRIATASTPMPIGAWTMVVFQRSGSAKQIWQAQFGSTATKVAEVTVSLGACSFNTPLWMMSKSSSAGIANALIGTMAYGAFGAFALSQSVMDALAKGACPRQVAQFDRYIPLMSAGSATVKSIIGGTECTVSGTPTTGTQPMRLW